MPTYGLKCDKCEFEYDIFCSMSKKDEETEVAKCPECGSKKKTSMIGACNFHFSNPVGTDRWTNGSTGHDYRHNFNMDRPGGVRDQRKTAEQQSHVGPSPYNPIDDISSGEHFGEVK